MSYLGFGSKRRFSRAYVALVRAGPAEGLAQKLAHVPSTLETLQTYNP